MVFDVHTIYGLTSNRAKEGLARRMQKRGGLSRLIHNIESGAVKQTDKEKRKEEEYGKAQIM